MIVLLAQSYYYLSLLYILNFIQICLSQKKKKTRRMQKWETSFFFKKKKIYINKPSF